MRNGIEYGNLMHKAMRGLIRDVLTEVAEHGLPGQHHFFITFRTTHPEAKIADWLRDRYPNEMTVVMQHWFDNLDVGEDAFSVTLNFGDNPESLFIPYDSIVTFVDPSVEFGLRFESHEEDEDGDEDEDDLLEDDDGDEDEVSHSDAEIVSLDSFRK